MTETTVIVASNRGPVTFEPDDRGELRPRRGSGGLVTALTGALQSTGGLWVATAMTNEDREAAASAPRGGIDLREHGSAYRVRYLDLPPDVYDGYYNKISNGVLWFVNHYLWDVPRQPSFGTDVGEAWQQYVEVNRTFAKALAEEGNRAVGRPVYLIQDYHLALVPRMLRELRPDALISHFSHTAIAGLTYLRVIPHEMHDQLLRGMLGADVLGFHSHAWADNFLASARALPGARADLLRARIRIDGRDVAVRIHPISVDAHQLREGAASDEVRGRRREIERWRGDRRLLLRVDRLELSKNIVRGFQAFELFLRREPSWRGRVVFLAMLSPSRMELEEYRTYTEECVAEAERVNGELGNADWQPIEVSVRDDYIGALAAYGLYDVLLVNPVFDGMNLVAMEGPILSRRQGVLVLSRNAGAHGRLGRYAVSVNPFDIDETAEAIRRALEMPADERRRRARGLSRLVLANPPERWVGGQLEDLERARRRRR